MSKLNVFGAEARTRLAEGVAVIVQAVGSTLGPRGRNVVIFRHGGKHVVTKDGVTVARDIEVDDPVANMGVSLIRDVAVKTVEATNDGTTTAVVISGEIVREGLKNVVAGANPMDIRRGLDAAAKIVIEALVATSTPVDGDYTKIQAVATIASNSDTQIGEMITEAFKTVTAEGVITVEESRSTETWTETRMGLSLERGYLSPHFMTDIETSVCTYENPLILILEEKIKQSQRLVPALQLVAQTKRPLLIIADDLADDALNLLLANRIRNRFPVVAIRSPWFGRPAADLLQDIAILTGGVVFNPTTGFDVENIILQQFGEATSITVTQTTTTILVEARTPAIEDRITQIRSQLEKSEAGYERDHLQKRLAKLVGGAAILKIGGRTEVEMRERRDRVEDALGATRAALAEGVVAGGGTALALASTALEGFRGENSDQTIGGQILRQALTAPLRRIAENSGVNGGVVLDKILSATAVTVYNAQTGAYEAASQILDPTKVERVAVEFAVSVAGLILTTDCVIAQIVKE